MGRWQGKEQKWEVEKLLAERCLRGRGIEYLVKWEGWATKWNSWEAARNVHSNELITELRKRRRAATRLRSPSPKVFIAPSPGCGEGLFARQPIKAGDVVCLYGGAALPTALHQGGAYVVDAEVSHFGAVIDGRGDNSSFSCHEEAGIMANHSGVPNAELTLAADPLTFVCSLVALEDIEAGEEIRVDYEPQGGGQFWGEGGAPPETDWHSTRTLPPTRSLSASRRPAPMRWEEDDGGDARLWKYMPEFREAGVRLEPSTLPPAWQTNLPPYLSTYRYRKPTSPRSLRRTYAVGRLRLPPRAGSGCLRQMQRRRPPGRPGACPRLSVRRRGRGRRGRVPRRARRARARWGRCSGLRRWRGRRAAEKRAASGASMRRRRGRRRRRKTATER